MPTVAPKPSYRDKHSKWVRKRFPDERKCKKAQSRKFNWNIYMYKYMSWKVQQLFYSRSTQLCVWQSKKHCSGLLVARCLMRKKTYLIKQSFTSRSKETKNPENKINTNNVALYWLWLGRMAKRLFLKHIKHLCVTHPVFIGLDWTTFKIFPSCVSSNFAE